MLKIKENIKQGIGSCITGKGVFETLDKVARGDLWGGVFGVSTWELKEEGQQVCDRRRHKLSPNTHQQDSKCNDGSIQTSNLGLEHACHGFCLELSPSNVHQCSDFITQISTLCYHSLSALSISLVLAGPELHSLPHCCFPGIHRAVHGTRNTADTQCI